eukprot:1591724-Amphidinium_carterae.1
MLYKYLDNEGNMNPHYVTGDNGIEHDHTQCAQCFLYRQRVHAIYNATPSVLTRLHNATLAQGPMRAQVLMDKKGLPFQGFLGP